MATSKMTWQVAWLCLCLCCCKCLCQEEGRSIPQLAKKWKSTYQYFLVGESEEIQGLLVAGTMAYDALTLAMKRTGVQPDRLESFAELTHCDDRHMKYRVECRFDPETHQSNECKCTIGDYPHCNAANIQISFPPNAEYLRQEGNLSVWQFTQFKADKPENNKTVTAWVDETLGFVFKVRQEASDRTVEMHFSDVVFDDNVPEGEFNIPGVCNDPKKTTNLADIMRRLGVNEGTDPLAALKGILRNLKKEKERVP